MKKIIGLILLAFSTILLVGCGDSLNGSYYEVDLDEYYLSEDVSLVIKGNSGLRFGEFDEEFTVDVQKREFSANGFVVPFVYQDGILSVDGDTYIKEGTSQFKEIQSKVASRRDKQAKQAKANAEKEAEELKDYESSVEKLRESYEKSYQSVLEDFVSKYSGRYSVDFGYLYDSDIFIEDGSLTFTSSGESFDISSKKYDYKFSGLFGIPELEDSYGYVKYLNAEGASLESENPTVEEIDNNKEVAEYFETITTLDSYFKEFGVERFPVKLSGDSRSDFAGKIHEMTLDFETYFEVSANNLKTSLYYAPHDVESSLGDAGSSGFEIEKK